MLVFRRTEIGNNASTASHEVGHFLSLPHTFRGWDCGSWSDGTFSVGNIKSPVTITTAPCALGNVRPQVELVTRGAGANCARAGDLFCDTPADYNFGFGHRSCTYTGDVVDRNGDLLRPDEKNFMGYFLNCNPYRFSDEQVAAMKADLRSSRRRYLGDGSRLVERDTVKFQPTDVSPADGSTTLYANEVNISWASVENATFYFLEVATSPRFQEADEVVSIILSGNQTNYTGHRPNANTRYYFKVRPFNQLGAVQGNDRYTFTTSNTPSSVSAPQAVDDMTLFPNPAGFGQGVSARLLISKPGRYTLAVHDVTGRLIQQEVVAMAAGSNQVRVAQSAALPTGAYFLRVSNDEGVSTRRFVIQ